jgi:outer membrane protein assembly factor BamB
MKMKLLNRQVISMELSGKQLLSTIALILLLTISGIAASLPIAKAHTPPYTVQTWAFLSVEPDPIGVGQAVYVNFWVDKVPPTANSGFGDRFQGFKVTVTKPDGTATTLGPFTSDDVGGAWTTFTPPTIGNYTFVFNFPGQTIAGANPGPFGTSSPETVGDYYSPSTSATVTLTVQQQPVVSLPNTPLPTGFWQRPIQSTNELWASISGNWLGFASSTFAATGMYNASGNFNPYTKAPNTAHIVWTKPEAWGGMIGGEFGGSRTSNYYSTSQYEPKFAPIIMNGVLYYTWYPGASTYPAGWVAVDLRTGQTIWTQNNTTPLTQGQIYNYQSPNQYGGLSYLWTGPSGFFGGAAPWSMYDAMTGNWILNIVNGTTAYRMESSDGSILGYYVNFTDGKLYMWNSSACILNFEQAFTSPFYQSANWMWRPPQGGSIDWRYGIMWKVPVAQGLGVNAISNNAILMTYTTAGFGFNSGWQLEAGYSAIDGHLLWGPINRTITPNVALTMGPALDGVYTEYVRETGSWDGYSITTGQHLWGPTAPVTNAWSYYGINYVAGYGNLYTWDFGGYVHCYNLQTGTLVWSYHTPSGGYNSPYSNYPLWTFSVGTLADGKLFVPEGHMYSPPLFNGAQQLALNATSGQLIWSIKAFDVTSAPGIADGIMVTLNAYDNQIYAWGIGQSATTVTASPAIIPSASPILIQGTVTDQSPGQTCLGIPAKGTPAISDASMSAWMEYLYMQQSEPTNATGVPVILTAIDPNGNTQNIGTVTSDILGNFAIAWTPPVPGLYTVIANFVGTNSYYGSIAETHFVVK